MTTSALIVGLGAIGMGYDLGSDASRVHSHARALSTHPAFSLIGGVDPAPSAREAFIATYGAPAYGEIDKALEALAPDLVVVASPTRNHWPAVRRILEVSPPSAVLCEKPLSYDVAEARQLLRACDERQVQLFVNYPRRSDPGPIEVKRRIEAGRLGDSIKAVVWYSKGFLHNGSHFFNLLEYWLGPSTGGKVLDLGRSLSEGDSEPDVQVTFQGGSALFLAAWEEAYSHYTIELVSRAGRLRYERGGELISWERALPDPGNDGYTTLSTEPEIIPSGRDRYQWHVVDQLARRLEGKEAEICGGQEALQTLESMTRLLVPSAR